MFRERYFIHRAVWIFAAGSMAGFLMESFESMISFGYVQNRQGLLYGPFTPVYGTGALMFALFWPVLKRRSWPIVFSTTALIGTVIEYMWSLGQETFFGAVFWDYANLPLHLNGRTSPVFALLWGILGVFFLKGIYKHFYKFIETIPPLGRALVTWVLLLLMTGNTIVSSAAFYRQGIRQNAVAATSSIELFLDEVYPDERLKEQFPTMKLCTNDEKTR